MKSLLLAIFVVIFLSSCHQEETLERSFVDIKGIDHTIRPGDNFFRYVNGIWYDTATIAEDQVGVGSYMFLNIPQKLLLQNILEKVSHGEYAFGSIEQKVGDFYASGMDTTVIDQRGYEPIQLILKQIDVLINTPTLMEFVSNQIKKGNYSIINWYVYPDDENSNVNMAHFSQAGLGLPDRDYYFKTDTATVAIQTAYRRYIAKLFELTGSAPEVSIKYAQKVYDLEKELAASHKTRVELRDVKTNYHKVAISAIEQRHSNIRWAALVKDLYLQVDSIDMRQPGYYDQLDEMLTTVSIPVWKLYLKAHSISNYANVLSKPFEQAAFEYSKVLSGQSTQKNRAQLMVQQVDQMLGYALGQLYVKRYFNEGAKKRVLELVNNLQKAFENRMDHLDWMSDSTKLKAKEKLYAITKKIGYPDEWRKYDGVTIDESQYFENILSIRKNEYQYKLQKLSQPPDHTEWHTTPSTVTAYYNPAFNEIVFPAGILQYPYFDFVADDAINYGGIGMVIGHELTHAFDDSGAQRDKDGNVKNWWTEEDYKRFNAKTQQIIDRYNTFTVLDSMHINGALTVGENTADNGGISIAYDAFKMTSQGQDTTRIDGLTPDQRFFYSIARIWRVKTRDEFLRTYVNTNPHSPAMWRVNGPLMNFTPFYEAFNVQPGNKNYRPEDERIKVW